MIFIEPLGNKMSENELILSNNGISLANISIFFYTSNLRLYLTLKLLLELML